MQTLIISDRRNRTIISVVILAAALALPFLIHLIPTNSGIPMGAYLLPMFYAPLVALLLYGIRIAFLTALLAPGVNLLITGSPDWYFGLVLTLELLCFTLATFWLIKKRVKWIAVPLGFLLAKTLSAALISIWGIFQVSSVDYFLSSVSTGIWGIFALLMIHLLVLRFWNKPMDN